MSSTVIVTGGAGYIGSHTCKALAKAGFTPVTYDSLIHGHELAVRFGPLERGDVADRETLAAVFRRHRPVAVLHFAGFIYVGESVKEPLLYYRHNVAGTLTLLEAMQAAGVDRIVFSSSAAVYGIPARVPIVEDTELLPINPYGASKHMAERLVADAAVARRLHWAALRYFNAAGADPEGELGEAHDPEPHLVPRALAAAAGDLPQFEIFGDDYDTPDGTCIRDYIHVADLADAHVAALRYVLDGKPSRPFNVGTGHGYSVREVVDTVKRITGRDFHCPIGPRRAGDPSRLVADVAQATELLGLRCRYPSLADITSHAWAWYQKRPRSGRIRA